MELVETLVDVLCEVEEDMLEMEVLLEVDCDVLLEVEDMEVDVD